MCRDANLVRAMLTTSVIVMAMTGVAIAGPFAYAYAAYDRGDYATALRLLGPLVEEGNADAQDLLAVMYYVGQGVPQNRSEAIKLYRLAAEQGNVHSQDSVGFAYFDGVGVPQDKAEAAKWFSKAADQGNIDAQLHLGEMYEVGTGVPQNYVLAYMWLSLVAAPGTRPYAEDDRDRVAKKMTPAQIAQAQKLVREWKPKPERP